MKRNFTSRDSHLAGALVFLLAACSNDKPRQSQDLPPPGLAGAAIQAPAQSGDATPAIGSAASRATVESPRQPDAVVLRVNGVALTQADYERAMLHQAAALGMPYQGLPERFRKRLEAPAYNGLLKRELLRQAAIRDGVQASPAAIAAEKARLMESLPPGRTFAELLERMQTDETKFLEDLATDMSIAQWMKGKESEMPVVDDAYALRLYGEQRERFASNEQASARQILIALHPNATAAEQEAARSRATDVRNRVNGKDESSFIEVAKAESDDVQTKAEGGDLGLLSRTQVLPQISDVVFSLAKGEVSDLVRSDRGFHILRGGGVTRGAPLPFEEVKERILLIAQTEVRAQHEKSLFQTLERAADIVRHIQPVREENAENAFPMSQAAQGAATGPPHALPLPSKDNVLPGVKNPHGTTTGQLRVSPGEASGLRLAPQSHPSAASPRPNPPVGP